MEKRIIDGHPSLKETDIRFKKTLESIISSFEIEGIRLSQEELLKIEQKVRDDLRLKKS